MSASRYFWKVCCQRNLFRILVAFSIVGVVPAQAQSTDLLSQTLDTCLISPEDHQELLKSLTDMGWENVPNTELSESEIAGNTAILLSAVLRYGSRPKAEWELRWELAHKSSNGLKRLKPMPENIGTRQFFVSSNGSFLDLIFKRNPWATDIICSMALRADDMALTLSSIGKSSDRNLSSLPPFTFWDGKKSESDQVTSSYYLVLVNSEKVTDMTDQPMDFSGVANSYFSTTPPSR